MAFSFQPKVVSNGLVLYVDAGNTKSYPGSGTVWTDLSPSAITGSLTNGPTFSSTANGAIVFDGTNDFVQCNGGIVTTAATFLVWMYRNGAQVQFDGVLFSRGTSVTGLNISTNNQVGYHWNDASNTYFWASGLVIPDLQWSMCVMSVSSTSATAYLCQQSGITSASNIVSHTSTTIDDIKIGQDEAGNRFFTGNISIAQIYNRALSATEVLQNYNALKGRFGLT
jgi:hypothetical protein